MQAALAEARVQHCAMAGTVLIEGATGPKLAIINGVFEVAERPDHEPPIYRRADDRDGWLFVNSVGGWVVSNKEDKDERKTSSTGWAFSVEAAQGRLPHEVGARWMVSVSGELTEHRLRVLHGKEADAAIANVCAYACTHASTHTSMHTRTYAPKDAHTHTRARRHVRMHACTHARTHAEP